VPKRKFLARQARSHIFPAKKMPKRRFIFVLGTFPSLPSAILGSTWFSCGFPGKNRIYPGLFIVLSTLLKALRANLRAVSSAGLSATLQNSAFSILRAALRTALRAFFRASLRPSKSPRPICSGRGLLR